ncbi:MAG: DUF4124 domain-containing protein [Dokdonella sp.]
MQSRRVLSVVLVAITGLLATAAQAQNRYKWRDGAGQTHYSDVLSNEAMRLGYEIVNKDGLVIRRVNRPLTDAERLLANKAAVQSKARQDADDARLRRDQQLLAAFPTEADLKTTQNLTLNQLDQSLIAAHKGLQTQESSLADLLGRADDLQHRGTKVPVRLTTQITELRSSLEQQRNFVERKERERTDTANAQAAQLLHYRKLKLVQKAQY